MIFSIRFLPEVEEDIFTGYSWYEEKSQGLGEEFLRIFYESSNYLTRNALIYKIVYGDFRRTLLRRFPYAIYYMIGKNEVIVFGLFHCARDPKAIRKKLLIRKRGS